jgi:nitrogen fixation/metabolism regulation signal transduction histidine kinase
MSLFDPEKEPMFTHPANASLRAVAEKQLASKKLWVPPAEGVDRLKLIHELQVHQIELEMQTEVLQETLAQADALRIKYQDLFEFAPVGYLALSRRGTIFESNKCAAQLLNQKPQALVGRKLRDFVTDGFLASLDDFLAAAGNCADDVFAREIELLPARAFPRFVNMQAHAIAIGPGGETQIRLAMMDVSALKMATEDVVQAMDKASGLGGLQ